MDDLDKHRTPELDVVRATHGPALPGAARPVTPGLARYFRGALDRLNYLEYGDPSEYLSKIRRVSFRNSPLESVWVPPRFKKRDEAGEDVVLDTLLRDENACLLVLADPGCGKSTLARFLTTFFINRFVAKTQDYFGLLVPLSTLRTTGLTYQEAIVQCAAKYVGLDEDQQVMHDLRSRISDACVVFDGLDELPIARRVSPERDALPLRGDAATLIRALLYVHVQQADVEMPRRSIVTSRSKDYFEDRRSSLGAVPHYFISRFSPAQMDMAVCQWHEAARARVAEAVENPAMILDALDERRKGIQSALREQSDLATVCLTPLMLNVLQAVYSDAKDIPSSVSQLCWRAAAWFLVEKHKGSNQDGFVRANGEWLIQTLTEIGWRAQKRVVSGQTKSFDDDELRRVAKVSCPLRSVMEADYQAQEDAVTLVASFLRRGHGILVSVSDTEFDFAHNVFREVMAGRALGRVPVPERRQYALNERWIGPIRYWAGLRAADGDGMYEICAFVGELSSDADAGNVQAILARGEMLVEVCSTVPARLFTVDLKSQISQVRDELYSVLTRQDLRIAQRIRIGDLLAVLGDTRLNAPLLDRVCWIEASDRVIGRSENHRTRIAKYQSCPASPPVRGRLGRFGIGSFLVTNREFRVFIEAGAYKTRSYWPSDVSWKWVTNDSATVSTLIEKSRAVAGTHLSSELVGQRLVPDEIPERCVEMIRRSLPLYWLDPAYNRPNQPIVGINWWEAVAYCAWLDENLRNKNLLGPSQRVRLPVEAEWETAARLCGSNNSYPWLEGEPADCAHVRAAFARHTDQPIFRSCAVGLFLNVRTALPIYDLVGNVWEWTGSKSGPYTDKAFDQVVSLEGLDDRISRGTSWLSSEEESTQVTFRSFDPPYNVYEDLGFRIVIEDKENGR